MHVLWMNRLARSSGGAEWYVGNTASLLVERGHECSLLHETGDDADLDFMARFSFAAPLCELTRQVEELRPDVVFVNQFSGADGVRELAALDVPVVRFFHDHEVFCPRRYKYTTIGHETCTRLVGWNCIPCLGFVSKSDAWPGVTLRTPGDVRAEQRAHHDLAACVVASEYMRKHLTAHGFPKELVHVLPLYVDPPPADEEAETVEREESLLVFAGALLRGKGLDVLLEALPLLPDGVELAVAGAGHQEGLFRGLVSELDLGSRVRFIGRAPREELAKLYRRATCVVIPSREPETFGLVGPEAMLRGAPVVTAAVGGTGEWAKDGKTAWTFPSGDVPALAKVLRAVLQAPEERAKRAAAGRELCAERFTAEAHVTGLLDVLTSAAGARTSSGVG